ncbi:LPS O-antigen length regulator Wzz(fepE) [Enterobacter sp. A103]|uniref:LPS O-antigen length regulator Wzz(fepE) n=1 Tax=Enterobacter sp. A103 TaxID=3102785 RepID=UPI002AC9F6BC|nr:LPS O-antigen length regulator Wzz(fepE) [Enterobacter sp. A103]MDZ5641691.1 LPS O-antigen length regulator Wzz(fepE) [Enterobacter sp. A103]
MCITETSHCNHKDSPLISHLGAQHRLKGNEDEVRAEKFASFRISQRDMQYPAELDLLSLLNAFWRARRLIAICVVFFALASVGASMLLPHKWTSSAIVTPVDPSQWAQLQQSLVTAQSLGVSYPLDRPGAFDLFIKNFQSQQLTEEYIKSKPALLRQYSGASEPVRGLTHAASAMFLLIKSEAVFSGKNEPPPLYRSWRLSFTGPDAQSAQDILKGYIRFVADRTVTELQQDLHDALLLKINTDKSGLALASSDMQNIHLARIQRLSYALQIAESAGITAPVYTRGQSINDDPDFSVALGAKGLASKLNIEKSLSDLTELNPELRNRKYRLEELEKISIPTANFPVFSYQVPPSYPEKSEGPGIILIYILGSLLGGLISGAYVLLFDKIASIKQQSKQQTV